MRRAESDLEKEWSHSPTRRRLRLPRDWSWQKDPMGGHLAGAIMLVVGLIALAAGHWKFGAFMTGLGLLFLLIVSFAANHFRTKKPG
jgi:hypothetical protein